MGELNLIAHFRAHAPSHPWMQVGPGQDCAVLSWPADRDIAFKIDQVIEGTHFVFEGPHAVTARQAGWKAMAKTCSDIAATGFWPVAATVAVNLRRGSDERLAMEIYEGITDCCRRYNFALAGGDVATSDNRLSIVVSMLGDGPKGGAWQRSGAIPGDVLLITGVLGASIKRKHFDFSPRLDEAKLIRDKISGSVHACIDITDGLSRDLRHLCEESDCGAAISEQLPFSVEALELAAKPGGRSALEQALGDGEDFELLLAVSPDAAQELLSHWNFTTPLTVIGSVERKGEGIVLIAPNGTRRPMPDVGYEHRT